MKVDFSCPRGLSRNYIKEGKREYTINGYTVHFCGMEFPIARKHLSYDFENPKSGKIPEDVYIFQQSDLPESGFSFLEKQDSFFDVVNRSWIKTDISGKSFNRIPNVEMHRILKTPVFITGNFEGPGNYYNNHTGRLAGDLVALKNPILRDFGFDKLLNDFDCFQMIEQFISNELVGYDEKDIDIPDELKAESHGFDKFSFRKGK